MSALAIDQHQQIEQVLNHVIAALHSRYPHITPEVVYDPPDGVDAWVRLHGAADTDEWDEIRHFAHTITDPVWEQDGILILMHGGDFRNGWSLEYPPLDPTAREAAITADQSRRRTRRKSAPTDE